LTFEEYCALRRVAEGLLLIHTWARKRASSGEADLLIMAIENLVAEATSQAKTAGARAQWQRMADVCKALQVEYPKIDEQDPWMPESLQELEEYWRLIDERPRGRDPEGDHEED
jgi:hypothetical protein